MFGFALVFNIYIALSFKAGSEFAGAWVARHNDLDQWIRATLEQIMLLHYSLL